MNKRNRHRPTKGLTRKIISLVTYLALFASSSNAQQILDSKSDVDQTYEEMDSEKYNTDLMDFINDGYMDDSKLGPLPEKYQKLVDHANMKKEKRKLRYYSEEELYAA